MDHLSEDRIKTCVSGADDFTTVEFETLAIVFHMPGCSDRDHKRAPDALPEKARDAN